MGLGMADAHLVARRGDRRRRAAPCARKAAFELLHARPEASAGHRLAPPPALVFGPAVFLTGLLCAAPAVALAGLACLGGVYVAAVSALRLGAALTPIGWSPRRRLGARDLPLVTVIVALYREAQMAPALAASLSRLDYPRERLQILFALEEDDVATLQAARSLARRSAITVLVAPRCGPRTKPRALNYALQAARGELVAVYDAEDAPHPGQLRAAAEAFAADDRLAVVQAPLNWYNRDQNWLTRQFALEYAAQFHGVLPVLARLGLPLPLGGTSNVFRRDRLAAAGGWDPFNVTEDADLGFRLARAGWKAGVISPGTGEEAPVTARAWTAQRSRWLKGHLMSWLVQMRDPRGLINAAGWRAFAALQLTLLANVLSAGLHGPGLLLLGAGAAAARLGLADAGAATLAAAGLAILAYGCAMACAAVGMKRAGFTVRPSDIAAMPVYWLLQAPALIRALREFTCAPYFWAKTRHGVSTARREALHDITRDDRPHGRSRGGVRRSGVAVQ